MKQSITYLIMLVWMAGFVLRSQTADSLVFSDREDTCRIQIVKLRLNSEEEDFSPVMCNGKMLFASARPSSFGVVYKEPNEVRNTNIYYASKKSDTDFSKPELWPGPINTHYNEGSAVLNKTEDLLIYTGNERSTAKKAQRDKLYLYSSTKINGRWQDPQPLWFCGGAYSYCHPSLKEDGKTLFFASDRPGSVGGMDIYCSTFENGKWSEPQNVGTKVNTAANELFPAITTSDVLYFSSDRPGGKGGLDLYALDLSDPIDNELQLLEYPINSEADDFSISPDSSGESGYFSSSRNKGGKDDIYYFNVSCPEFKDAATPAVKRSFCYTFFEEATVGAFDTDSLEYEWDLGDGTVLRGAEVKHCYTKCGSYAIQLNIVEKYTGALFYNQVSYDHVIAEPQQLKIECADELLSNQHLKFNAGHSSVPGYTIRKMYWMFGDHTYGYGERVRHLFKAQGSYTVTLGVIATNNETGLPERFKTEKTITIKDNF